MEHEVKVRQFRIEPTAIRAECSCGWRGPTRDFKDDDGAVDKVQAEGQQHLTTAA